MSKTMEVHLNEDEAKFILAALDRSQIQGLGTARMLLQIAEKLAKAGAITNVGAQPPAVQSQGKHNGAPLERVTS